MRAPYLATVAFLLVVSAVPSSIQGPAKTAFAGLGQSTTNRAVTEHDLNTALSQPDAATQAHFRADYGKLPLAFEANQGQTDQKVRFLARGRGYTMFLTDDAAVLTLPAPGVHQSTSDQDRAVVRMKVMGANSPPQIAGIDEQPGKSHYFIGNDPTKWRTNVVNYSKVKYKDAYPGVDLVYYGNQQQLEYDFVVAPGANPSAILLDMEVSSPSGIRHSQDSGVHRKAPLRIAANGDLIVDVQGHDVAFSKPVIYQGEETFDSRGGPEGQRSASTTERSIEGRWVLKGETRVGFEVSAYDATKPLIIDPALNYSTYLGGSAYNSTFGLTLDSAGNAYVTGDTLSADFPVTTGAVQTNNEGGHDAFVTKLNTTGTALVYSTYLGGNSYDRAVGIAVDGSGDAYVVGTTGSTDFPITTGAFQTVCTCSQNHPNAFVSELNPAGSALVYSTYLGGNAGDYGSAIALDGSGDAIVAGRTCSADFPVTPGAFQTHYAGGCSGTLGGDAYVTELNATGTALIYSTYIGGSGVDAAYAVGVDSLGNAYVSGNTNSTDFPTTPGAFQTTEGGGFDTFVAKVNPTGSALVYSTYLGGSADETTWGIKVDSAGSAYLAGQTQSTNFPITAGAFQTVCGGSCAQTKGFVIKVNPSGAALDYATYLGGNGADAAFAIAVDGGGGAYVTGQTGSTNFPTTRGAFQATSQGGVQAFVTRLNVTGSAPVYSTFFFGNSTTTGLAIAVNNQNHSFVVAGRTYSTSLPTTPGAFKTNCSTCTQVNKASNGFVAAFVVGNQIWPLSLNFGDQAVGVKSAALSAVLTNSTNTQLNVTNVQMSGANSSDFIKAKDTCTGTPIAVGFSCAISVAFKPSAIGAENATLTVTNDGANSPQQVILQGTGTDLQLAPSSLGFARQKVGTQSLSKQINVTNKGNVTVNISGIGLTGANAGDFAQTNTCGPTLTQGSSCAITVTFTPTATGPRTAAVSITDDGGGSPQQAQLTGTGT